MADVAALAGFGEATVDRVLNERGGVSPETINAVLKAAQRLGLKRILPQPHHAGLRIEVLLNRRELPLIARMSDAFEKVSLNLDRSIIVQRTILADDKPHTIASRLRATSSNAVILYAPEDPVVIQAVNTISAAGVAVVTVISDLPTSARLAYAGIDHFKAGATAGFFLSRMVHQSGPILVLCHSSRVQSHVERIRGLQSQLTAESRGVVIAEILEGQDDVCKSERLLNQAIIRHPDVVGVYNVGAAHQAVGAILRRRWERPTPTFIGHELTTETREMLDDRTMTLVIDQNPHRQAQTAVDILLSHYGFLEQVTGLSDLAQIPFTLHGPFNS